MIVAGTGHRPNKLGGYGPNPTARAVAVWLGRQLDELNPDRVISGMALGVDQWLAQLAVRRGIPFTAAVPFAGQESAWPARSQELYARLLSQAADVVYVCAPGYDASKMQLRNEWMVDHSDVLLAVWDGTHGGTRNCLVYAKKVGRRVERIDPNVL